MVLIGAHNSGIFFPFEAGGDRNAQFPFFLSTLRGQAKERVSKLLLLRPIKVSHFLDIKRKERGKNVGGNSIARA